jgi:hypothetical protein
VCVQQKPALPHPNSRGTSCRLSVLPVWLDIPATCVQPTSCCQCVVLGRNTWGPVTTIQVSGVFGHVDCSNVLSVAMGIWVWMVGLGLRVAHLCDKETQEQPPPPQGMGKSLPPTRARIPGPTQHGLDRSNRPAQHSTGWACKRTAAQSAYARARWCCRGLSMSCS